MKARYWIALAVATVVVVCLEIANHGWVLVSDSGVKTVALHQKRQAVRISSGYGATTVYRARDGSLRATVIMVSRVPVSFDRAASLAQVEVFHRYF